MHMFPQTIWTSAGRLPRKHSLSSSSSLLTTRRSNIIIISTEWCANSCDTLSNSCFLRYHHSNCDNCPREVVGVQKVVAKLRACGAHVVEPPFDMLITGETNCCHSSKTNCSSSRGEESGNLDNNKQYSKSGGKIQEKDIRKSCHCHISSCHELVNNWVWKTLGT
ncbi:unnamed protein product [Orchesella dallaii]|uniref:Uncharacterized protein n=1 Tax=Orchesella dallaii TaxID=48710 RepID=A0ABP1QPG6_9HEXA